jgi:dTDP-4-dehydrorhamnose reductase
VRFAVIGSRGLLGAELVRFLNESGREVVGFDRSNIDIHVLAPEELVEKLDGFDVVVNAAAFTRVDDAETEIFEVNAVNAIAAGKLAQASALVGARFIQMSTDYVFNGVSSKPYLTSDTTDPQTEYGRSKALGELLVSESGADYAIIRTAWLYGSTGKCFPKTIANVLERNGSARVVADQHGQPTWTRDLARLIVACAELSEMPRILHGTSSGVATWSEFAGEVAKSLGLDPVEVVVPVSSAEYATVAVRPKWSVLDNSSVLLKPIGDWRERWRIAADEVLANR